MIRFPYFFAAALLALPSLTEAGAFKYVDRAVEQCSKQLLKNVKKGKKANVAILPFENPKRQATELGRMFAESLTDSVLDSGRFTVVDRSYISRMMNEIQISAMGLTDAKTAVEVGNFSGAQYLLVGRLEPYGRRKLRVQTRLLRTGTAELISSAKVDVKMTRGMRKLYETNAALDPAASGLFTAEEKKGDAIFLGQTGPGGCRWVEAHSAVPAKKNVPAARAAAIAVARRKAVGLLLGRAPQQVPDFSQDAYTGQVEKVLRATQSSRIEEEKVTEEKRASGRYYLTLQTCLRPLSAGADKNFQVELMLNQNRFFEGQKARAVLTTSQDAYIYLYSVDFDQNASPVFPVDGAGGHRARAGKPFSFPSEAHRRQGVALVAQLPEGKKTSIETFRVIAVKKDLTARLQGQRTYPDIVRVLDGAGVAWAEDVRIFTIYTK